MRRLIALRLALRGLRTTDLRHVVGYDEAVKRAVTAERELAQLKAAIDRVRAIRKAPGRSLVNAHANAQDDGWDQALDAVNAALDPPEEGS